MEIVYDPNLRDYMTHKGTPHVVVDVCTAKTCGGPIAEMDIQMVSEEKASELRPRAQAVFSGEVGEVLIMAKELEVDPHVTFRLKSFFGIKDVAVEGIRTYRF